MPTTLNLPHKILRAALSDAMPDAKLDTFSMYSPADIDGVEIRFAEFPDIVVQVSGYEGADLFREYTTARGLSLTRLIVPNIYVGAYEDGDEADVILAKPDPTSFTTTIDLIVDNVSLWRTGENDRRHKANMDKAVQRIKDMDEKYFPFKSKDAGGCAHTDLINDASHEVAIEIINAFLKVDPEKGPQTLLTEAFGSDEEIGDQLQSLLMATYQRALVDLLRGDLSMRDVISAGIDGGVIEHH
jgi:hypothetical protein